MSSSPPNSSLVKLISASLLLALAAWMTYRSFFGGPQDNDLAFFYDISERELFTAPRTSIPPIKGLNDDQPDAARAVVISTTGKPRDKSSWQVAYLEVYSPELKQQMEQAQTSGGSPAMGRALAQSHRLVRRVDGTEWHSLDSTEGEAIIAGWLTAGPNGGPATVCVP